MFKNKKIIQLFILTAIVLAIKIFSLFPEAVEKIYSQGLYTYISRLLRTSLGFIPFSVGDILYTIFGLWLIYSIIKFLITFFKTKQKKLLLRKSVYPFLSTLLYIYIFFYILWGLNYSRLGMAQQLDLNMQDEYTTEELVSLTSELIQKTNAFRKDIQYKSIDTSFHTLKQQAIRAYVNTSEELPFLAYKNQSIKIPVYNVLGNYLGYSGYINPFTNEAHVNTKQPAFLLPFVICHEMAHQLGYGTEDEANFIGYLAAKNSEDVYFHYSAYFQLYRYANRELFYRDSLLAKAQYETLDTLVKSDIIYMEKFFKKYENPYEKYVTMIYNRFLQSNNQPQGIATYSQVTAWMLAYRKKYQKL